MRSATFHLVFYILLGWGGWIGFLRWMQKGRFEVLEDSPGRLVFRSNCELFTLHRPSGTLVWDQKGRKVSTRLEEIKGIDYLSNDDGALALEFLDGFDLTDLWPRYRDTVEHHEVALVTERHGRVPVFYGSRWQRREFLLGWFIDLQDALLVRSGLIRDVEQRARDALALLQARMGKERATR
jgi:hypothetical protein